jgi:lactate dehydrogenase-like 2-hydroxyacid dehydrogenase
MKTILLTNKYDTTPYEIIESAVPDGFGLLMLDEVVQQDLENKAPKADYILASGRLNVNEAVLIKATKLKMIQRTGVGLNSLELDAIRDRNIPVYVNQGVNSNSVAEHTIMLILACLKKLPVINNNTKSGIWKKQAQGVLNRELGTQTVGVIGMGNIGQKVAKLLRAFGATVLYHDFNRKSEIEEIIGIRYVSLEELFAASGVITLHCALTDENKGLINRSTIEKMKNGVVIINTARGQLIDEDALVTALASGKVAFVGLDVFNVEPANKTTLLSLKNVIATPHISGVTFDSFCKMMRDAMRNIELFDMGRFEEIEQHRLVL